MRNTAEDKMGRAMIVGVVVAVLILAMGLFAAYHTVLAILAAAKSIIGA